MPILSLDTETLADLDRLIESALQEDLREGVDCTSRSLFKNMVNGSASFIARGAGVMCGIAVIKRVLANVANELSLDIYVQDGEPLKKGQRLAKISGDAREILLVERTCLNFIGRLCGIATLTAKFAELIACTSAKLYDTRKTTPGWRRLEKYAVRCGGGVNHRMGLFDAILIKDNHLAMLAQAEPQDDNVVALAIANAQNWVIENAADLPHGLKTPIQIEVDHLEQLKNALPLKPDMILLDNMNVEELTKAVELRNQLAPTVELEASGGINLQSIAAIAKTGIDRISVGALTHSAINFDIGLDWNLDGVQSAN